MSESGSPPVMERGKRWYCRKMYDSLTLADFQNEVHSMNRVAQPNDRHLQAYIAILPVDGRWQCFEDLAKSRTMCVTSSIS